MCVYVYVLFHFLYHCKENTNEGGAFCTGILVIMFVPCLFCVLKKTVTSCQIKMEGKLSRKDLSPQPSSILRYKRLFYAQICWE